MLSRLQKTYADQPVLLLHGFFPKNHDSKVRCSGELLGGKGFRPNKIAATLVCLGYLLVFGHRLGNSETNTLVRGLRWGLFHHHRSSPPSTSIQLVSVWFLRCASCCFLAINLGPKSQRRIPTSKPLQSNMWLYFCRWDRGHVHVYTYLCVVYLVPNKIKYEVHKKYHTEERVVPNVE